MSVTHAPLPIASHPSGIPILRGGGSRGGGGRSLASSSTSPLSTPLSGFPSTYSHPSEASGSGGSRVQKTRTRNDNGRGRNSPDLGLGVGGRSKEGFIKNELPPFRLAPDEAVRIAHRGEGQHHEEGNEGSSFDEEGKRKRVVESRATNGEQGRSGVGSSPGYERRGSGSSGGSDIARSKSGLGIKRNGRPSTSGSVPLNGKSSTNLGMGYPSSHQLGRAGGSSSSKQGRSSSATQQRSNPPNPKSSFTPRSASMNVLASSTSSSQGTGSGGTPNSRLGVAAHFIPPESSYTPPKGADWDEVVLPTVAKKLGIGEGAGNGGSRGIEDEEDLLAVEWDRDGTPIRWVKRKGGKILGPIETAEGNTTNGLSHVDLQTNRPTPTAFSPTFEPSPDNPFHSNARPSQSQMRYQRSNEGIELGPIRTTMAQTTTLSNAEHAVPSSHSPFSSFDPRPAALKNMSNPSISKKTSSQSGLGRKPSFLGKQSDGVAGQRSDMSQTRGQAQPPQVPGTTHQITDAIYEGSMTRQRQQKGISKEDDTHGKGCGCVIM
ncbi:hypothetical protein IAR55_001088 [Kwoniella newhampshirensis]|uniref:Uncharacterized protein n=1 Tax=Kwoniella newhampshirensis TaxID=1651941 RepID=A0AAW0Z4P9_9TREE